jgi:outer membrane protein assembly factor BamB
MKHAMAMGAVAGCLLLLGATGARAQDWPQWRGPNRDNKVTGFTEPKAWPKELKEQWKVKVGEGDASPVLAGDRVYVFARQSGEEVLRCLDVADGKEVWSDKSKAPAARVPGGGHDGPRASPAVADGKVCTFGVDGTVSCYEAAKGKLLWRKEGRDHPGFWTAASPIITDGKCVVLAGGDRRGALTAYDLANGDEKWKWTGEGARYGSPVLMTVDKTKMIVTPTSDAIVGVGAEDGKLLWKAPYSTQYNSSTPLVDGQTVIYSTQAGAFGGRGGTVAWKVEKKGDGFEAKELWKKSEAAGIYNTPVLKDGRLYGLTGGNRRPAYFFCMSTENGETLWTDSKRRGECAAIVDAGTVLIGLSSDSDLVVFKPSKKGYEEVAKYKAGTSPWTTPIIAGKRVIVKDRDSVILWTIEE